MRTGTHESEYEALREGLGTLPSLSRRVGDLTRFKLSYDVSSPEFIKRSYAEMDSRYKNYTGSISTKQVPDVLSVYHAGNSLAEVEASAMLEGGFTLVQRKSGNKIFKMSNMEEYLSLVKGEIKEFDPDRVQNEDDPYLVMEEIRRNRKSDPYTIDYEDPWKLLQAYSLSQQRAAVAAQEGKDSRKYNNTVRINVWHGDKLRMQDKIPVRLIPGWTGGQKKKIPFTEIASVDTKLRFIYERTFWGRELSKIAASGDKISPWAKDLQRKLSALLMGKPHPKWSKEKTARIYLVDELRPTRARAVRLIECLKTVNGLFLQRFLAFPNEEWSWGKFDMHTLRYLDILIDDEFYDGDLRPEVLEVVTRYQELKQVRKTFKMHALSFNDEYIKSKQFEEQIPHWLRTYVKIYRRAIMVRGEVWSIAIRSTLAQTRGMGTPPPLVIYQAKKKFLTMVSEPQEPLSREREALIRVSVRKAIQRVPEYAFTGLTTKARIVITSSACWERTRQEGGTIQAISDLMLEAETGRPAYVIDLITGEFEKPLLYKDSEPGEYIFWRCLEEVLSQPPEEVSKVYLTIVKEPAKARVVSKGLVALKMVLDVVNKIASYPLSKVESSKSGMSADAHGWRFFSMFFEHSEETFTEQGEEITTESENGEFIEKEVSYKPLYVESTDYSNATDAMNHEIGWIIADAWMTKCGIPPVLKSVVQTACFSSRTVYFNGRGAFSNIGKSLDDGSTIRTVNLVRGVLMGDPLTKVILHFTNISVRELGRYLASGSYKELIEDNPIRDIPGLVDTLDVPMAIPTTKILDHRSPKGIGGSYRPFPPRLIPIQDIPSKVSFPEPDTLRKYGITFPFPGVILCFTEGNWMSMGYIPKEFRHHSELRISHIRDFRGNLVPITVRDRNPDDRVLIMAGIRPVCPYSRTLIKGSRDMELARERHRRYLANEDLHQDYTEVEPQQKVMDKNLFQKLLDFGTDVSKYFSL